MNAEIALALTTAGRLSFRAVVKSTFVKSKTSPRPGVSSPSQNRVQRGSSPMALFHCMVRYGSARLGTVRYGSVRVGLRFHCSLGPL